LNIAVAMKGKQELKPTSKYLIIETNAKYRHFWWS
jgi:hypothetical protein